jgi:ATP-binding cassette, subfamily B, bacterial MsbA
LERLLKLWPFVRPHRHRLIVALIAAAVASSLWAGALLLTFPITKVLMQQQSLGEYIALRISQAELDAVEHTEKLASLQKDLTELEAQNAERSSEYLDLLQERTKAQNHLARAARDEWWHRQLQHYLVPYLPADRFETLAVLFVTLLVVSSLHGVAVYMQEVWIGMVVHRSLRSLRTKMFRTTLELDAQTLGIEGTPALMSRFPMISPVSHRD